MGQKASPYAFRLGYNQTWNTYFFPHNKKEEITFLERDKAIRDYLASHSKFLNLARIKTEYTKNGVFIYLYVPNTDLFSGEGKENLEKVLKGIYQKINDDKIKVKLYLMKIKYHAQLVANSIAEQLERRVRSRRILNEVITNSIAEREVRGIKIRMNGLLDGSEIAQKKKMVSRSTPFSRKDGFFEEGKKEVFMTRGVIGIQVFVYKGRMVPKKRKRLQTFSAPKNQKPRIENE